MSVHRSLVQLLLSLADIDCRWHTDHQGMWHECDQTVCTYDSLYTEFTDYSDFVDYTDYADYIDYCDYSVYTYYVYYTDYVF